MVYYWMNGVILGYKRKEDIYKLLRNFLSRGAKVASYDRDEIPTSELGKWRFWTKELFFRTVTLKEQRRYTLALSPTRRLSNLPFSSPYLFLVTTFLQLLSFSGHYLLRD
jgi:hypothetical protein